ncbi:MAG: hypothetical protein IT184_13845 [Acidobacteria bacterium]|nr:hypothetical protein [Acidobacteriota bacterium]
MPDPLEALDGILHGVDGGTVTAPDGTEQLLTAQIQLRNDQHTGHEALQPTARSEAARRLRLH